MKKYNITFARNTRLGRRKKSVSRKNPKRMEVPLWLGLIFIFYTCTLIFIIYIYQDIAARSLPPCFSKKLYKSVSKGWETVGFLEREEEPCPSSG